MPAYSRKMEALAEAIMKYSGYLEPSSELHAARNPGGLRATSVRHEHNELGQRTFRSFIDGINALLFDLDTKIVGKSWCGLAPNKTLKDLAISYALPATTATAWAKFLRLSLKDELISSDTRLSYFLGR